MTKIITLRIVATSFGCRMGGNVVRTGLLHILVVILHFTDKCRKLTIVVLVLVVEAREVGVSIGVSDCSVVVVKARVLETSDIGVYVVVLVRVYRHRP